MPKKQFDPLASIPSPEAIRKRLQETLDFARRLEILLEVSERIRQPQSPSASQKEGEPCLS